MTISFVFSSFFLSLKTLFLMVCALISVELEALASSFKTPAKDLWILKRLFIFLHNAG